MIESREDVGIASPCPPTQPLGDEVSGTGSPTVSAQEVVDGGIVDGVDSIIISSLQRKYFWEWGQNLQQM